MKKIIIVMIVCFLTGCSDDGIFEIIPRIKTTPFECRPVVEGFLADRQLNVSWEPDEGADEYILWRSMDPLFLESLEEVYRGTDLSFIDRGLENNTWYYYRVYKRRGRKIYTTELTGFGISVDRIYDPHEDNNTKRNASLLSYETRSTIQSTIWYYQDTAGNLIEDVDWYKVILAPHLMMEIRICDLKNLGGMDDDDDADILYHTGFAGDQSLCNNKEMEIFNYDNEPVTSYFKIYCDSDRFLADPSGPGGHAGSYTVTIELIQNL
jgi:hypothetical protein